MSNQFADERKGLLYATYTALLWATLALFLKFSLVDFEPITVVWFRFTFSFTILSIYFSLKKKENLKILKKPPFFLIISAIALAFNYLLFQLGLKYTNPSIANIIIQTGPVLLAFIGIFIYKERITLKQSFGFVAVIAGFIIFYLDQLGHSAGIYKNLKYGVFLVLLAAVAWALYAAILKKMSTKHDPQSLNLVLYLVPALMFAPYVNFSSFLTMSIQSGFVLLFLGLNSLLAYGFIAEAFKYAPASKVSMIITLNPILTLILMAILDKFHYNWLGQEMTTSFGYIGAFLVILGAVFAISRGKK